jgi:hypothetical protein
MEMFTNVLLSILVVEGGLIAFMLFKITKKLRPVSEEHPDRSSLTNYSVWKYDGAWRVVEDRCQPGFHPGDPPSRPGDYPGEIVRKPASRNK